MIFHYHQKTLIMLLNGLIVSNKLVEIYQQPLFDGLNQQVSGYVIEVDSLQKHKLLPFQIGKIEKRSEE